MDDHQPSDRNNNRTEDIAILIEELRRLHIRQTDIIHALLDATTEPTAPLVWDPNTPTPAERQTQTRREQGLPVTVTPEPFSIGDRVRIQNKVVVVGRRANAGDKTGTVYKITPSYVHVQTDNGQKIRRVSHNLRLVTQNE